ncbi:MAG: zonular occludens toxin domain-containing protein [Candidatus Methanomethylicaceae archaeon]
MITIISGRLGCGKSYLAVSMILDHLRRGGIVATNITLRDLPQFSRQIIHIDGNCLPTDLPSGDRRGHGSRRVMIVIDEALSWFSGMQGPQVDPRKAVWGDWLRHSDKLGQDIFLIAQEWGQIAKWIRVLSQRVWFCHSSKNERFIRHLPFRFLWAVQKNCSEVDAETAVRPAPVISIRLRFLSPLVYRHYDTAETYESDKFVSENVYERITLWPRSKDFALFKLSVLVTFFLFAFSAWLFFSSGRVPPSLEELMRPKPSFWSRILPS